MGKPIHLVSTHRRLAHTGGALTVLWWTVQVETRTSEKVAAYNNISQDYCIPAGLGSLRGNGRQAPDQELYRCARDSRQM